jgi:phosphoribosylformylglycinamidine synthase
VVLLGPVADGGLAGSRYAWDVLGDRGGRVAEVDHGAVAATAALVRRLVVDGVAGAAHDVAEGGLAVALAEMAMAGATGVTVTVPLAAGDVLVETPGRAVVAVTPDRERTVLDAAVASGVDALVLGTAGGDRVALLPGAAWTVAELAEAAAATRL